MRQQAWRVWEVVVCLQVYRSISSLTVAFLAYQLYFLICLIPVPPFSYKENVWHIYWVINILLMHRIDFVIVVPE